MSARILVLAGCVLLLATTACSRRLPTPSPDSLAETPASSQDAAQPVELAGGPPGEAASGVEASAAPASDQPDQPAPPASEAAAPADDARQAVAAAPERARPHDPLEPVNRSLYAVDRALGTVIAHRPRLTPANDPRARAVTGAARNVLRNLDEPSITANNLLQFKIARALKSAVRFVVNSTVGVAGVSDVASRLGLKRRDNNLDRTLAKYGAPAGPYLYLPVIGPTTLRAAIGTAAEGYLYPPHWLRLAAGLSSALRGAGYARLAQRAVDHADARQLAERNRDGYAATRKVYLEARAAERAADRDEPRARDAVLASNQGPL